MAYDVEDNQKDAVFAKVGHMLVDYDLNLDLNKGDRTKIHKIIDEKSSKEKYVITYSDPIYFNSHKNVYEDNKTTYIWMAIKYSIKNPIHFVEYLFGSSPMVWDITRDDDWVGIPYETNITKAKDDFYNPSKKYVQTPTNYIDNATAKNSETSEYKNLESLVNYFRDNQITDTLFYSPALYMFLAFISMILIHWITKSKEIYLIYLPNMLNIIVIFLSTPIQDYRYLYPNLLVFYMILIMLISIYQKSQIKAQSF